MTRSTQALPGGAHKILTALRRIIPDGQRRKISQAEIARVAEVSEGTVSAAMPMLAGVFLVRHFVGKGRGNGYEYELLPPHELRPVQAVAAPTKGSNPDPCNRSLTDGITAPETPHEKGTNSDPFIFSSHAHEQQQQTGSPPDQEISTPVQPDQAVPEPPAALAPETVAALTEAGAHPKLIARVATVNPGCTADQVAAALAAALCKPNAHTPPGLALECLANRQQVVVPRARPEPTEARKKRPLDPGALTPEKIRAYIADGYGGDAPDDAPGDEESEESLLAQADAARAAPDDPPELLDDASAADEPEDVPSPAAAPPAPPGDDPLALAIAALGGPAPTRVEQHQLQTKLRAGASPEAAARTVRAQRDTAAWLRQRKTILRGGT
jgi:hypothetical protein